MTTIKTIMIRGEVANVWTCRKCGLLRCSRHTHRHGIPLPKDIMDIIEKNEAEQSSLGNDKGDL